MEGTMEETKPKVVDLLNDREAAAYFKLAPKYGYITVQRWARMGVLRGGKIGDHWVFRIQDLDDFIFAKK